MYTGQHNVPRKTQCTLDSLITVSCHFIYVLVCGKHYFLTFYDTVRILDHNIKDSRLIWKFCGYERWKDRKTVLLFNLIQEYQLLFLHFYLQFTSPDNVCKHVAFTF